MKKSLWSAIATVGTVGAVVLCIEACTVTRKPDGTITVEPADGGKPVKLPPQRVRQITINGKCYHQFEGPNGVWYCFPCDLQGTGYAEPCDSIINPQLGFSPPDPATFLEFFAEWFEPMGIEPVSGAILETFGLDTWKEGDEAPVPLALSLLNTDDNYLEVIVVSRSDWEWPDNTSAFVECLAFPDDSGSLPSPLDSTPDAMAFRVSGSLEDVASAVSYMFEDGFTWETTFGQDVYSIISERVDDVTFAVSVLKNGTLVWSN
jgi:hypothetical protein